jgi:hypothetical protein
MEGAALGGVITPPLREGRITLRLVKGASLFEAGEISAAHEEDTHAGQK